MFNIYSLKNDAFKQDDNVSHMRKFYISSIHIFLFYQYSILICRFYICKSYFHTQCIIGKQPLHRKKIIGKRKLDTQPFP